MNSEPQRGRRRQQRMTRRQRAEQDARNRRNRMIFLGAVGAALVVALALIVINQIGQDAGDEFPAVQAAPAAYPDVPQEGTTLGNPDAEVHLVEWSDYQCPACRFFTREVKSGIVQDYVATGQVYMEFRHFPFLGDESLRAAEASMCAADQGEFWRYHETVFLNQQAPPRDQGGYSEARLLEMGEMIGLDMDEFEECVTDRTHQSDVEAMREEAGATGITGTPQFQLNGERLELQNYDELRAALDAELSGN